MPLKYLKEFQEFINKGNVIDLAVGVIIGASFGEITKSLVKDVLTPPIGYVLGRIEFRNLAIALPTPTGDPVNIAYGLFIQASINFIITAFAIFWLVKIVNRMKRKEEAKPAVAAEVPADVKLLAEIRDILQQQGTKPVA